MRSLTAIFARSKWLSLLAILLCASADADRSVQIAASSDGKLYSAYPAGNAPAGGASCSTWTCAQKGDADGEIDEDSSTQLSFSASGSDLLGNIDYAYQLEADSGDIQVKVRVPASYTGYVNAFSATGPGITEGTGDDDYFFQCACPDTGSVRVIYGTPSSATAQVGAAGSCYSKYLAAVYDVSETALACYESTDDVTYTQVGSAVTKTLSCSSDCPAYLFAGSNSAANTTFATMTAASVATTIDVVDTGEDPPDPDPPPSLDNILWQGDYSTCDFTQWHPSSELGNIQFHQMPAYGRPVQYGSQNAIHVGDGSLLSLVKTSASGNFGAMPAAMASTWSSHNFGSACAAKITVKNSANGTEPADCDVPYPTCSRRRTELTVQSTLPAYYNALPYLSTRWMSYSVFIPSDWDSGGSGWGPGIWQLKPQNEGGGNSGMFELDIVGGAWQFYHRWDEKVNPSLADIPWQQQMFYSGNYQGGPYPGDTSLLWAQGKDHFPDVTASRAALASFNKGGWTDWVFQISFDARAAGDGGQGFIRVWKREDEGAWVYVLNIVPTSVTRGGVSFDMGIGFNSPPTGGANGGFGIKSGMYGDKGQFWGFSGNRVLYHSNIKVGGDQATFADMSPDGSTP